MSVERKTIAIVGGTLWGNRGAEAMLLTTIGHLRQSCPNCKIMVFSYYPERDAKLCYDRSINFYNFRPLNLGLKIVPLAIVAWILQLIRVRLPKGLIGREVDAIRNADMVCDIGGITFNDGREIFLLFNVLSLLPAFLFKIPIVKLSQAMGPFQNPINRFFAKQVLPRCNKVFARGRITASYLQQLGLSSDKWAPASDIAFAWKPEFTLTEENKDQVHELNCTIIEKASRSENVVAIVPSSLVMKKSERYIEQLSELVIDLAEAGVLVILLPNATREDSGKGRNNDLVAIRAIVDRIRQSSSSSLERLVGVDFDVNTDSIRQLMAHADIVITSRFHGMVAALAGCIPTIVIGWSHKYLEVMEQFGCSDLGFAHDEEGLDLTNVVIDSLARESAIKREMKKSLQAVHDSALSQFRYLESQLQPELTVEEKQTSSELPELESREKELFELS